MLKKLLLKKDFLKYEHLTKLFTYSPLILFQLWVLETNAVISWNWNLCIFITVSVDGQWFTLILLFTLTLYWQKKKSFKITHLKKCFSLTNILHDGLLSPYLQYGNKSDLVDAVKGNQNFDKNKSLFNFLIIWNFLLPVFTKLWPCSE